MCTLLVGELSQEEQQLLTPSLGCCDVVCSGEETLADHVVQWNTYLPFG